MRQFISRAYNDFQLDESRGLITKISEGERIKNEINYYKILPTDLAIFFPRFFGTHSLNEKHFLELEYYNYSDLGKLMVERPIRGNEALWHKIFVSLKDILGIFFSYSQESRDADLENMYIEKTVREYNQLKEGFSEFKTICNQESLVINNKRYKNFEEIWPSIEACIRKIFVKTFRVIHGDLCFSNILYGEGEGGNIVLKLIDPRGSFGEVGYWGDYRYDLAKLFHSFEGGYEYIIHDSFKLENKSTVFSFEFINDNRSIIKDVFYDVFSDSDFFKNHIEEFKILEGLIFIGMCARHYDSVERQKIMYCTGVKILNEYLEKNL